MWLANAKAASNLVGLSFRLTGGIVLGHNFPLVLIVRLESDSFHSLTKIKKRNVAGR
jgi:hypothetical protein